MSIMEIILFLMVVMFFVVGIAGIFLPVIPSLPVVWCGILLYAILTNFSEVTITVIVITGALMLVGTLIDLIASAFGARTYGASWFGVVGSLIGTVIGGIIFNIVGLIIGAFVGAFVGEFMLYKKAQSRCGHDDRFSFWSCSKNFYCICDVWNFCFCSFIICKLLI